jgi:hypothetical protein
MRKVADFFRVSVTALHWRLVGLKLLNKASPMLEIMVPSGDHLQDTPAVYSKAFLSVMAGAIDRGDISVGRLAKLIQVPRHALRSLFAVHKIAAPITV